MASHSSQRLGNSRVYRQNQCLESLHQGDGASTAKHRYELIQASNVSIECATTPHDMTTPGCSSDSRSSSSHLHLRSFDLFRICLPRTSVDRGLRFATATPSSWEGFLPRELGISFTGSVYGIV